MGEGSGGAIADAPRIVAEPQPGGPPTSAGGDDTHAGSAEDRRLVAAVRAGDDRAFEALYTRYHRRINAYVYGMVKDHGRAEDVTQEVFVSAVRRMRQTERPIAFKPWIYEIAKNACIDQYRRSRRAEEVSFDANEGLAPNDYGRLVGPDPTPDAAVAAKQDLDHLCGAFGGLSDTHHEILVLRELEGLSYREIGDRMGMSRPAVESTLFRARRRLTEEYDELVSGARCVRIRDLIERAAGHALGVRETRRLARHVAHCQPCRRAALVAGVDPEILTHVPARRRVAEKLAGLLPIPWLVRHARGSRPDEAAASLAGSGGGPPGWLAQLTMFSDQLGPGWGKLAAVGAVAVGLGAAGAGTQVASKADESGTRERAGAAQQQPAGGTPAAAPTRPGRSAAAGGAPARDRAKENGRRERARDRDRPAQSERREGSGGAGDGGTQPAPAPAGGGAQPVDSPASSGGGGGNEGGGGDSGPVAKSPVGGGNDPVKPVVNNVTNSVGGAVQNAPDTVGGVTDGVNRTVGGLQQTVEGVPQGVPETVDGVNETVGGVGDTVDSVTEPVEDVVDGATGGLLDPQP